MTTQTQTPRPVVSLNRDDVIGRNRAYICTSMADDDPRQLWRSMEAARMVQILTVSLNTMNLFSWQRERIENVLEIIKTAKP